MKRIQFDMRIFVNSIRNSYPVQKFLSINSNPTIREDINRAIYEAALKDNTDIPFYTGALRASPAQEGGTAEMTTMRTTKKGTSYPYTNIAHGWIDSSGIHYDPYHIAKKTGIESHYAIYRMPSEYILLNLGENSEEIKAQIRQIVYDYLKVD